jgi:hypothetical protein
MSDYLKRRSDETLTQWDARLAADYQTRQQPAHEVRRHVRDMSAAEYRSAKSALIRDDNGAGRTAQSSAASRPAIAFTGADTGTTTRDTATPSPKAGGRGIRATDMTHDEWQAARAALLAV